MTNEELQKIYVKADMKLDALKDNIHHLAEENKQLKKHHIIVRPYTNDEVREEIDNYKDNIKQLFETIIEKQKRIDKAIEYIKTQTKFEKGCDIYKYIDADYLIELLGGKNE